MKRTHSVTRAITLVAGLLVMASCGATIKKLHGDPTPSAFRASPLPISVGIEMLRDSGGKESSRDSKYWGESLASVLIKQGAFKGVVYPYRGQPVDRILKGTVVPTWTGGLGNFFTYFPGGLVFAPAWRGVRFEYGVTATIEVFEPAATEKIRQYTASTSFEFTHRSFNPMHFLGAALVAPAVITGSLKVWPRERHREMVYEQTYSDLWRQMAETMLRDPRAFEVATPATAEESRTQPRR